MANVTEVAAKASGNGATAAAGREARHWARAKSIPKGLTGDGAAAEAMRQIDPDVVAAYPITPQTEIVERFAEFVADGSVTTEFVAVESEHSALSACCGAAASGARAMTCTASQGLALMHEILYIAAGQRLPIVMPVVNRALSAPINIHGDHSDTMGSRDCGWIQLNCHDAQEVYDSAIQAIRIAEDPDVLLPVMITFDGFQVSHDMERVEALPDDMVKEFIGSYHAAVNLLDAKNPQNLGWLAGVPYYFEHRVNATRALTRSLDTIEDVDRQFGELSGRSYGLIETHLIEDAEIVLVAMATGAGTARAAVDQARERGIKAGSVRIRAFRPFPVAQIVNALRKAKVVAVLDRAESPGASGAPAFSDIRTALYDEPVRPQVVSYVYGLGGRDLTVKMVSAVLDDLAEAVKSGKAPSARGYLGLRE